MFKGYWRMPEKTAAEFRADGFFITGDLGRIDERGYVHIVGRAKDLIISGGFNVYPKEVESEIDALEGVVESAVIGAAASRFRRGRGGGGRARARRDLDESAIREALEARLAKFKTAQARVLRRGAAAQRDGQGAEGGAARDVQGYVQGLIPLKARAPYAKARSPRKRSNTRSFGPSRQVGCLREARRRDAQHPSRQAAPIPSRERVREAAPSVRPLPHGRTRLIPPAKAAT